MTDRTSRTSITAGHERASGEHSIGGSAVRDRAANLAIMATPPHLREHLRVLITSADQSSDERFHHQVAAIRELGATYTPEKRRWHLFLDPSQPAHLAALLTQLLTITRTYGSSTTVQAPADWVELEENPAS